MVINNNLLQLARISFHLICFLLLVFLFCFASIFKNCLEKFFLFFYNRNIKNMIMTWKWVVFFDTKCQNYERIVNIGLHEVLSKTDIKHGTIFLYIVSYIFFGCINYQSVIKYNLGSIKFITRKNLPWLSPAGIRKDHPSWKRK